jgi:aryl-alcohol dehydrogenase-like predicted oxidoreductase
MIHELSLPGLVGLGTAPLGSGADWELDWGHTDRSEAEATVRAAVAAGVGWIDTAAWYGWGRAEEIVAAGIDGLGARPLILTKCGDVRGPHGETLTDNSPAVIRRDLAESLARLRTGAIDVLQLHDPDPRHAVESSWETICALIEEGKVVAGGLSNHAVELMDRALSVGPVSVVQHQYSLLHRSAESDGVLDWCADHAVPFLAWSPLASGFLAAGFDIDALGQGDLRRRLPWADPDRLDHARLVREMEVIGAGVGMSITELSIGWVLSKGAHAIVGARSPAEAECLSRFGALPPDSVDALETAVERCWA